MAFPLVKAYIKGILSLRQRGTFLLLVGYFSPIGRKITYKGSDLHFV
jgi:hypothetical protein